MQRERVAHRPVLVVRLPLLVMGGLATAAAIALAAVAGVGPWAVVVFAVLPDLALFIDAGSPQQPGQLPRRAVPVYNLLHHPAVPALLLAVAVAVADPFWAVAALSWGAHILIDRGLGYGLRNREGWQRG